MNIINFSYINDYIKDFKIAVDLGCGYGSHCFELSKKFDTVYGIDISYNIPYSSDNVVFLKQSFDEIPVYDINYVLIHRSLHFSNYIHNTIKNVMAHTNGIIDIYEPFTFDVGYLQKGSPYFDGLEYNKKINDINNSINIIKSLHNNILFEESNDEFYHAILKS